MYVLKYAWYRGTEVLFNTRYHANSLEHIVPHMMCSGRETIKCPGCGEDIIPDQVGLGATKFFNANVGTGSLARETRPHSCGLGAFWSGTAIIITIGSII